MLGWIFGGSFAAIAVGLVFATWRDYANSKFPYHKRPNGWDLRQPGWGVVLGILGAIAALVSGIALAVQSGQRASCHNFGRGTGFPVKFVTYANGWAWTCFAKPGKVWLPKDKIIKVVTK